MPCHLIQQNANRAFGESPLAFEAAMLSQCARNREQKTKGGTAFAAVEGTKLSICLSICAAQKIEAAKAVVEKAVEEKAAEVKEAVKETAENISS